MQCYLKYMDSTLVQNKTAFTYIYYEAMCKSWTLMATIAK